MTLHMSRQLLFVACLVLAAVGAQLRAQNAAKSVDEGVYSDVQAMRGASAYDQTCGRCHRQDLSGADGPALKDDRFNRNFAGRDLRHLYTRMATTMPRGAPGSISDGAYLDILAYMLRENGFPAGPQELISERLDGVEVLPTRMKPLPAIGDFSYVEVVGCLTPGSDGAWMLSNASQAVVAVPDRTPAILSLGDESYRLLDALAYDAEAHRGHKVHVRGLLIRLQSERRMTISSFQTLASNCTR
jgi:cytochrome c5